KTGVIYRTQGKPENELRFRKPVQQEEATSTLQRPVLEEQVTLVQPAPPAAIAESALDSVAPPVLEIEEEPAWTHVKMSRLERETLKVAIATISAHREPAGTPTFRPCTRSPLPDPRSQQSTGCSRSGRGKDTDRRAIGTRTLTTRPMGSPILLPCRVHARNVWLIEKTIGLPFFLMWN